MAERHLDSLEFSRHLYGQQQPAHAFRAKTREEAAAWQGRLSEALIRILGGFPASRCALNAEILDRKEFRTYSRETVLFDSRERMSVFAYFITPKEFRKPGPCMICIPGHGAGVDEICGILPDGKVRDSRDGYQHDFALLCADHGFSALAIEPLGFGHRRDEAARKRGAGASSCQPAAGAALLLGQCMIGWRLWDIIRGIDYLETRADVDAKRIGLMGISGGGMMTLFGAALEPADQGLPDLRLLQYFPRQHLLYRPLHRQLHPRPSRRGRDVGRCGPHRSAAHVRGVRNQRLDFPHRRYSSGLRGCPHDLARVERRGPHRAGSFRRRSRLQRPRRLPVSQEAPLTVTGASARARPRPRMDSESCRSAELARPLIRGRVRMNPSFRFPSMSEYAESVVRKDIHSR